MKHHGAVHRGEGTLSDTPQVLHPRLGSRGGTKEDLGFPGEFCYTGCEPGLSLALSLATRNEVKGTSPQSSESWCPFGHCVSDLGRHPLAPSLSLLAHNQSFTMSVHLPFKEILNSFILLFLPPLS